MRASLDWLRTLCDPGLEPAALAECLTRQGLEVAAVVPVPAPSRRIVAARLTAAAPIPRTNYKRIVADAGPEGVLEVVSAAPNVAAGMAAALALPGAHLPDGRLIEAREYAGVGSEAMLCSAAELGLGESSDRLLELPPDAPPGVPLATLYELPDTTLEIELTPNRGDCLSLLGIAREIHAGTGAALTPPAIEPVASLHEEAPRVRVDDAQACPRYLARIVTGLDPRAATPPWMSERLRRSGLRSTHPVVDVLNYVMLELGQPMHAFDRDALTGPIRVRRAHAGERLILLGGADTILAPDMLVIADDVGPQALAGIMGGQSSAVGAETRSIMLESAYFAPPAIRGRARRLGLTTEASHRFERGVGPRLTQLALERATRLLADIAGGVPGPIVEAASAEHIPRSHPIFLMPRAIPRLAGIAPDDREVRGVLERLGFDLVPSEGGLEVTPPSFRFDLECEADVVEEVARIIGFDRIPDVAPVRKAPSPGAGSPAPAEGMAGILAARGYNEALTMSFADLDRDAALAPTDQGAALTLANPLAESQAVLRRSLWPGLVEALAHNASRQVDRVRLFECGRVFAAGRSESERLAGIASGRAASENWTDAGRPVDFYDVKGDVETLLQAAGLSALRFESSARNGLAAGRRARVVVGDRSVAELGVLAPELAERWGLPADTVLFEIDLAAVPVRDVARAHPVPRFPAVRRDLALVVPDEIQAAAVTDAARRFGGPRLVEVRIFDIYAGPGIPSGTRSVGLGLVFRDLGRTLTDAEVDAAMSAIMTGLTEETGAHVRA